MTPRKRLMMIGLAALVLAVWLVVTFTFAITDNVQTDIGVHLGEASADVTLGDLQCRETLSQSFPFFRVACEEVGDAEVEP